MTRLALIDDDALVRESVSQLLQLKGYEIRCFETAELFLQTSDSVNSDCLVVDYQLPGMNGCELVRRLREGGHETPVVLLTGNVDTSVPALLSGLSNVKMLGKPCLSAALYQAIESCIARPC